MFFFRGGGFSGEEGKGKSKGIDEHSCNLLSAIFIQTWTGRHTENKQLILIFLHFPLRGIRSAKLPNSDSCARSWADALGVQQRGGHQEGGQHAGRPC